MSDHARRSTPADSPSLSEFAAMGMGERWVSRSPEAMLQTFQWSRGEGFGLIVEDLLCLPAQPAVITEGVRLLPHMVRPLLAVAGRAVWRVPTPAFRRAAFESRCSLREITRKTSDPDRALPTCFDRDPGVHPSARREARRLGLRVIDVDTVMSEDERLSE